MSDFTIYVCYDPHTGFQYTDEHGNPAKIKRHCSKRKTIQWAIKPDCNCRDLTIQFPFGNPFNPSTPNPLPGVPYAFNDIHSTDYKYDVTLTCNGQTHFDDPEIMFDDGSGFPTEGPDLQVLSGLLPQFGNVVAQAFDGVLSKLKGVGGSNGKRDPDGVLYPGGINNIQVNVTVPIAGVSLVVGVTVSGSEPTVLSGAPHIAAKPRTKR